MRYHTPSRIELLTHTLILLPAVGAILWPTRAVTYFMMELLFEPTSRIWGTLDYVWYSGSLQRLSKTFPLLSPIGTDLILSALGAVGCLVLVVGAIGDWMHFTFISTGLTNSRTRSVAVGHVELAGIARKRAALTQGEIFESGALPYRAPNSRTILFDAQGHMGSNRGGIQKRTHLEVFDLEDASGRIRIDPRAAKIVSEWPIGVSGPRDAVYLTKRKTFERDHEQTGAAWLTSARLEDGDPVYVLGTAQVRDDAADDTDSARLVIAEHPKLRSTLGPFSKVLPFAALLGRRQVFAIADGDENSARKTLAHFSMLSALYLLVAGALLCGFVAELLPTFTGDQPPSRSSVYYDKKSRH